MINQIKTLPSLLMITMLFSLGFSSQDSQWKKITAGVKEAEIKRIIINPLNPDEFWITTYTSVYRVKVSPANNDVSVLTPQLASPTNAILNSPDSLYLATDEGLYQRKAGQYHFQRIFSSSDEKERQCLSVIEAGGKIFLGTRKGLFVKDAQDVSWQAGSAELRNSSIEELHPYGGSIYVVSSESLYRMDPMTYSLEKIFTKGLSTTESEEETPMTGEESGSVIQISDVKFKDAQNLYIATQDGIVVSHDAGKSWESMPADGLPHSEIRRLLIPSGTNPALMVATSKGVFQLENDRWVQLYQGLESNDVNDAAQDAQGNIYAGTSRGLFILEKGKAFPAGQSNGSANEPSGIKFRDYADIERYFSFEPTILDVHAMAIDYAEVHPDKIKQWRKRANRRALAPTVSTGVNRSATDLLHWDTGTNPDTLVRGKEFLDWDAGLSWNLGDLIWNNDQTSIDSRSKLMVELREDVLDQVTRIYFERRRLQIEVLTHANMEAGQKIEQEMRLAELTAIIDGFTGGKFSRAIDKS